MYPVTQKLHYRLQIGDLVNSLGKGREKTKKKPTGKMVADFFWDRQKIRSIGSVQKNSHCFGNFVVLRITLGYDDFATTSFLPSLILVVVVVK
jgi:hypothetical protein